MFGRGVVRGLGRLAGRGESAGHHSDVRRSGGHTGTVLCTAGLL